MTIAPKLAQALMYVWLTVSLSFIALGGWIIVTVIDNGSPAAVDPGVRLLAFFLLGMNTTFCVVHAARLMTARREIPGQVASPFQGR